MKTVIDYYDRLAKDYDIDRFANSYGRYIDTLERGILRAWLSDIAPTGCIDFGCGTGRLLEFAMTGVDGSEPMLSVAAQKFTDRHLVHANIDNTPLDSQAFSAGYCFHVVMHLDRPTLEGIKRIDLLHLKPPAEWGEMAQNQVGVGR